jgi:hypothetical protein
VNSILVMLDEAKISVLEGTSRFSDGIVGAGKAFFDRGCRADPFVRRHCRLHYRLMGQGVTGTSGQAGWGSSPTCRPDKSHLWNASAQNLPRFSSRHRLRSAPASVRLGMKNQNNPQKQWQQDVAASELDPPKLLDIAIPYEEVLETARQIAAHSRERIRKIADTDPSNTESLDEI